jgi:hypothetical protein
VTLEGHRFIWGHDGQAHYVECCRTGREICDADVEAGVDAIQRACQATWCEWDCESGPLHWQWPEFHQTTTQDGLESYVEDEIPVYQVPQRDTKDTTQIQAMISRFNKMRSRGYIKKDDNVSLTMLFTASKVKTTSEWCSIALRVSYTQPCRFPAFGYQPCAHT